jgi:hypothetical protein
MLVIQFGLNCFQFLLMVTMEFPRILELTETGTLVQPTRVLRPQVLMATMVMMGVRLSFEKMPVG